MKLLSSPLFALAATLSLPLPAMAAQGVVSPTRVRVLSAEEAEILSHLSIVYLDDGQGGTVKTLDISGINVRIHNGLGATNGYPRDPESIDPAETHTNGLGNLIVGYNELGNHYGDDRTGSHNIVLGRSASFSSFGGLVGGSENTSSGPFGTVSGGDRNRASGAYSAISGGKYGEAIGISSSVGGGWSNATSGYCASATGGTAALVSGDFASISGGHGGQASGTVSSISGGTYNIAVGYSASISGGYNNVAGTPGLTGVHDASVSGGMFNQALGQASSISGGQNNVASGGASSVSGGSGRASTSSFNWAAGSLSETN